MGIKKRVVQVLSVGLICSSLSVPTFASESSGVTGGWTEGEGYWNANEVSTLAAEHHGWVEAHPYDADLERAVGETYWDGVYHYTRARMETIGGTPETDSGRQWDWDYTYAASPYAAYTYVARTYYGR
ncbi:hypothetical protein C8P63_14614 [Melghirimyces profundicolus]|uniref:Lactococcin 972 family bacteriocin n=1 Tax=Melghirimyces profundicolus TaxID=1242148 RepID=A0A2T6AWU9_9BACL|nr:hypothetical protein [Melghirimyces profundicolus]PTX48305.1 hypothetical protein C8P63_14614 [Melghirimyces profundicolus]